MKTQLTKYATFFVVLLLSLQGWTANAFAEAPTQADKVILEKITNQIELATAGVVSNCRDGAIVDTNIVFTCTQIDSNGSTVSNDVVFTPTRNEGYAGEIKFLTPIKLPNERATRAFIEPNQESVRAYFNNRFTGRYFPETQPFFYSHNLTANGWNGTQTYSVNYYSEQLIADAVLAVRYNYVTNQQTFEKWTEAVTIYVEVWG